jgi:hypothetical protein
MPEFDCQIVVPPSDTLKPSMLGPSVTVTGTFEVFVSVNVNWTDWPT